MASKYDSQPPSEPVSPLSQSRQSLSLPALCTFPEDGLVSTTGRPGLTWPDDVISKGPRFHSNDFNFSSSACMIPTVLLYPRWSKAAAKGLIKTSLTPPWIVDVHESCISLSTLCFFSVLSPASLFFENTRVDVPAFLTLRQSTNS